MANPFEEIVAESKAKKTASDPFAQIVAESKQMGVGERTSRAIDASSRGFAKEVFSLPILAAQGVAAPINYLTGLLNKYTGTNIPKSDPKGLFEQGVDWAYAKPQTDTERLYEAGGRGAGIAATGMTGGAALQQAKNQTVKNIGGVLGSSPVQQLTLAPVSSVASEKARQGGAGVYGQMAASVAAPVAISGAAYALPKLAVPLKAIGNVVDSALIPGGDKRATVNILRKLATEDRPIKTIEDVVKLNQDLDDMVAALKSARPEETAGQVFAREGQPVLAAGQSLAEKEVVKKFDLVMKQQKAIIMSKLAKLARGETTEKSMEARDLMKQNLESALGKIRDVELQAAGQAGTTIGKLGPQIAQKEASRVSALQQQGVMQTESAQQRVLSEGNRAVDAQLIRNRPAGAYPQDPRVIQPEGLPAGAFPVPGQPRVPPRYTGNAEASASMAGAADDLGVIAKQRMAERQFLENQVGSLEAHGLRPLTVQPIVSQISSRLAQKTTRVNDVMSDALKKVADKFRIAAEGGEVDPYALYEIRKTGVNQVFDELVASGKLNKSQAAQEIKKLRPMIDDAIENAGGTQWKSYITKYKKGFEAIERVALLDKAQQLYKQNPEGFLALVKGEKPDIVADIVTGKYKIADALPKQRMAELDDIAARIETDSDLANAMTKGQAKVLDILREKMPNVSTGILMREITLTSNLLRRAEGLGSKKVDELLSDLYLPENRQRLMIMLEQAKASTRAMIVNRALKNGVKFPPNYINSLMATQKNEENANP